MRGTWPAIAVLGLTLRSFALPAYKSIIRSEFGTQ